MTDVQLTDSEVFKRFLAAADEGKVEADVEEMTLQIVAQILNAKDADEVLGGRTATHALDVLDVPLVLTGVHFQKSDFDGAGPQFYAVLDVVTADGEGIPVTCGAKNVIAQAWRLEDLNALPLKIVIRRSAKPTANGFHVMWLEKAEDDF